MTSRTAVQLGRSNRLLADVRFQISTTRSVSRKTPSESRRQWPRSVVVSRAPVSAERRITASFTHSRRALFSSGNSAMSRLCNFYQLHGLLVNLDARLERHQADFFP